MLISADRPWLCTGVDSGARCHPGLRQSWRPQVGCSIPRPQCAPHSVSSVHHYHGPATVHAGVFCPVSRYSNVHGWSFCCSNGQSPSLLVGESASSPRTRALPEKRLKFFLNMPRKCSLLAFENHFCLALPSLTRKHPHRPGRFPPTPNLPGHF